MTRRQITAGDVDDIALGATVLGTGGGGDPHVGALTAKRLIRLHGNVDLITLDELADDDFVIPIGGIGAPSVSGERIMAESEMLQALEAAERATGRTPTAVIPIEVGGGNSMIPIATAAIASLPVVDADAMGRAFPEAQMVTFHLAGFKPGTTVMTDHHGNEVVTRPADGRWSERLARAVTVEMGGSATMIDYMYCGDVVRQVGISGTLTLAQRIGRVLNGRTDERTELDPVSELISQLDAHHLFDGKIVDLQRGVEGGFTRGSAELEGIGGFRGSRFELLFKNEMLLGRRDGVLTAVTPDLITAIDASSGRPITTESLRYGTRITVIGLPADDRWRTPEGLATAGPGYFGFDVDWEPIEELAARAEQHAASVRANAETKERA